MTDGSEIDTPSPSPPSKFRNWKWLLLITIVCTLCIVSITFLSKFSSSVGNSNSNRLAEYTPVTHYDYHNESYWKDMDASLSSLHNDHSVSSKDDRISKQSADAQRNRLGGLQSMVGNSSDTSQIRPHHTPNNRISPGENILSKSVPTMDLSSSASYNFTSDIHLVSLTVRNDFYILFNNSAISSWVKHIQNVRSITFIGPPNDYNLFIHNMGVHYPNYLLLDANYDKSTIMYDSDDAENVLPPVRWVNETHWVAKYKNLYRCPYPTVCQQLIKLYVFDIRTKLGMDYLGDNVLIVDSDTVWSRNVTFVDPNDGRVTYFEAYGTGDGSSCSGMDPVKFTEAITVGMPTKNGTRLPTLTPFTACRRPEYPNANGTRHIVHHMLFQYDVMIKLHSIVSERWRVRTLWQAFKKCHSEEFCSSRVAEYELYYSFVTNQYPERVRTETLVNNVSYMGSSAICDATEIKCCEERGVLLKGCHDHRLNRWKKNPKILAMLGDMCCDTTHYGVKEVAANHEQFLMHGL